jgi:hypothetical protein
MISIKDFEEVPIHHTKLKHEVNIIWLEKYSGLREQEKQLSY